MSRSRSRARSGMPLNEKQLQRKKLIKSRKIGYVLSSIQLIVSIIFSALLVYINMLPPLLLCGILLLLIILITFSFSTQMTKRLRMVGKITAVIISILLAFGTYYLATASGALAKMTGNKTKKDEVSVIVLKNDPAKTLSDVTGYTFGISKTVDRSNTDKAIENIKKLTGTTISYKECKDYHAMVDALMKGKVKAIIFNEANRSTIEEDFADFSDDTKVITTFTFTTKLTNSSNVKVTKEPFIVYLSGNDQTGDVAATGRTDVNICAVVNPDKKTILLVSTPRDAYVELKDPSGSIPAGSMDKLTHSGNFGIDVSMATLNNLYGIKIDHYVMLNFTGFIKIVDALGGVTIDSDASFTAIDGDVYKKGTQKMNGKRALNYARERKAFSDGDLARNRHQTQVLSAIINKMMSPAILSNYSQLMDGVSGAFRTSFESKDISSLVKMQLNDNASWKILSYNVGGTSTSKYTYSISSRMVSSVILNETDVANAKKLIKGVQSGTDYTQKDIDALKNEKTK